MNGGGTHPTFTELYCEVRAASGGGLRPRVQPYQDTHRPTHHTPWAPEL